MRAGGARRGGVRGEGRVGAGGGAAAGRGSVSVVRLESRRPAGPRGALHVPRALVIINFNKYKIPNLLIKKFERVYRKYSEILFLKTVRGDKKFFAKFLIFTSFKFEIKLKILAVTENIFI